MASKPRAIHCAFAAIGGIMWKRLLILLPLCACQQHVAFIGAAGTSPRFGALPNDRALREMSQDQIDRDVQSILEGMERVTPSR